MDGVDFAALFDGRQQVRAGLFAKAFELYDLVRVRVQMIEVGKIAQIAAVDELVQRLHGEAVDIKPAPCSQSGQKRFKCLAGQFGSVQRSVFTPLMGLIRTSVAAPQTGQAVGTS